jgi:hypothetical protein
MNAVAIVEVWRIGRPLELPVAFAGLPYCSADVVGFQKPLCSEYHTHFLKIDELRVKTTRVSTPREALINSPTRVPASAAT